MVRARFGVEGAGVCLQLPRGDFVTVCECWSGRDSGERTQQEALADRTGGSCGDVRLAGWRPVAAAAVREGVAGRAIGPGHDRTGLSKASAVADAV